VIRFDFGAASIVWLALVSFAVHAASTRVLR
jgi:hypothetical protein